MEISEDMTELIVPGNRCNDEDITVLDFSRFTWLKKMEIGDGCFGNVSELKLIGLNRLKSVTIGRRGFENCERAVFESELGWMVSQNRSP